jgi:hypothetical protein
VAGTAVDIQALRNEVVRFLEGRGLQCPDELSIEANLLERCQWDFGTLVQLLIFIEALSGREIALGDFVIDDIASIVAIQRNYFDD